MKQLAYDFFRFFLAFFDFSAFASTFASATCVALTRSISAGNSLCSSASRSADGGVSIVFLPASPP